MGAGWERRVRLPKIKGEERRDSIRYPLSLELRYTIARLRLSGSGYTLDLSSSGLRFRADRPLPIGAHVRISINWPVLLERAVQLQLIASGVVVWTSESEVAVKVERHEFRTRGIPVQAASG